MSAGLAFLIERTLADGEWGEDALCTVQLALERELELSPQAMGVLVAYLFGRLVSDGDIVLSVERYDKDDLDTIAEYAIGRGEETEFDENVLRISGSGKDDRLCLTVTVGRDE